MNHIKEYNQYETSDREDAHQIIKDFIEDQDMIESTPLVSAMDIRKGFNNVFYYVIDNERGNSSKDIVFSIRYSKKDNTLLKQLDTDMDTLSKRLNSMGFKSIYLKRDTYYGFSLRIKIYF